jgi:Peptidase family M28
MKNIKSPYKILETFLPIRNTHVAITQTNPISNRVQHIVDFLIDNDIAYSLDIFSFDEAISLCNINIHFDEAETDDRVIFTAHHDVNNVNSPNILDNTASVANLLSLAVSLKGVKLNKKCSIVFTDNEEFGGSGADFLSKKIKRGELGNVVGIINNELTGCGEIWVDKTGEGYISDRLNEIKPDINIHRTPFNDSFVFRRHGIPSLCLGIMPKQEMEILLEYHTCKYWGFCHQMNDDMVNANEDDMTKYVEQLKQFVI